MTNPMKTKPTHPTANAGALIAALVLFLVQTGFQARAADKTWVGGSGDWHDSAQWDPVGVPTAGDTAIFPSGGTVTVTQAVTIAGLALTNATINNTAPMVVTNFTCHSGLLAGDGLFVVAAGGTMTLPDNYPGVSGKILRLEGNTVAQGGSAGLFLYPDAAVENYGVLDLQDDSDRWISWGGEGSGNYLLNQGTLRKSGGTGSSVFQLGVVVTNAGTVEVLTGTIHFKDQFIQTAGETVLNGGDLKFDRRSTLLGGVLRGSGTVFGPLTNAATVSPGASAGALNILRNPFVLPGDYTQTSAGALNIELGGLTATNQYDVLNVEDEATLAGVLNISLINGFQPQKGNTFTIVTFSSRNGNFDTFNPPAPHLYTWDIAYTETNVVISVVNTAPSFAGAPTVHAGPEETPLSFDFSATDADLPAQTLNYLLVSPPFGASIHPTTGQFTWTPGEAVGPSSNAITVIVNDGGTPLLWATNTFQVVVHEVNQPPALQSPGNQLVNELVPLNLNVSASDPDQPANPLTMALVSGPPGLDFNPTTGDITWTPTEAQGPGLYTVTIKVTDNNPAATNQTSLSVTNSFDITVNEVNQAPAFNPIANTTRHALDTVTLTATATDADFPANTLAYSLVSSPAGADIHSGTGEFTWAIPVGSAGTTNPVTLRVVDNGSPPLSNSVTFQIVVVNPLQILASQMTSPGVFNVTWNSVSNHVYALEARTNVSVGAWTQVGATATATNVTTTRSDSAATNAARFYRVRQVTP